jgi:hypothetical protein
VDFKPDLLSVIGCKLGKLVQRFSDLFHGPRFGDTGMKLVGFDFHPRPADVFAQLYEFLRQFDRFHQLFSVGMVELLVGPHSYNFHRAVVKPFPDLFPFIFREGWSDTMGMIDSQFHSCDS